MNRETMCDIVEYVVQYSKGLIEDVESVSKLYEDGKITTRELEHFVEKCREHLFNAIDCRKIR